MNEGVEKLEVVDTSSRQLQYFQFKLDLLRSLEASEFRKILGYEKATAEERRALIQKAKLSSEAMNFLKSFGEAWLPDGFIFLGKWERTLLKISKVIRLGLMTDFRPLFLAENLDEQRKIFARLWPRRRLRFLLKAIANATVFNLFLYSGQMSKNAPLAELLLERLDYQFNHALARESFFLQFLFLGAIEFSEGWPLEAKDETIAKVKAYSGDIICKLQNMTDAMAVTEANGFSLSDVLSYLPPAEQSKLFHLGEQIFQRKSAKILMRTFLRDPVFPSSWEKWHRASLEEKAAKIDATVVYNFKIYSSI
jgi:S-adenosylmethionine-diacylglycerol 3-amino-3-carboxypropyl transferase